MKRIFAKPIPSIDPNTQEGLNNDTHCHDDEIDAVAEQNDSGEPNGNGHNVSQLNGDIDGNPHAESSTTANMEKYQTENEEIDESVSLELIFSNEECVDGESSCQYDDYINENSLDSTNLMNNETVDEPNELDQRNEIQSIESQPPVHAGDANVHTTTYLENQEAQNDVHNENEVNVVLSVPQLVCNGTQHV